MYHLHSFGGGGVNLWPYVLLFFSLQIKLNSRGKERWSCFLYRCLRRGKKNSMLIYDSIKIRLVLRTHGPDTEYSLQNKLHAIHK